MITPGVEPIPAAPGTLTGASRREEPRVFYTFRSRASSNDGDVAEMIEARRRELRRVRDGSSEAAEILREIALLQARSGRTREALESYRRGLDSSRRAGDHRQSARALESIIGSEELSDTERAYLGFGLAFEQRFLHQGLERARTIGESLDLALATLSSLPDRELVHLPAEMVAQLRER